jgi:hypothetical protein
MRQGLLARRCDGMPLDRGDCNRGIVDRAIDDRCDGIRIELRTRCRELGKTVRKLLAHWETFA